MRRFLGLRVIEDQLPVVAVTTPDGDTVRFAPVVPTDDAAEELCETLRSALTGAVVRVERLPRVEIRVV